MPLVRIDLRAGTSLNIAKHLETACIGPWSKRSLFRRMIASKL